MDKQTLIKNLKKSRQKITLTLPPETWDSMREHADGLNTTPSKLVEALYNTYLQAEQERANA